MLYPHGVASFGVLIADDATHPLASPLMDDIDGWEKLAPIDGTPLLRTRWSEADTENQVLGLMREYFPDWQKSA